MTSAPIAFVVWLVVFAATRLVSIRALYMLPTPTGDGVVVRADRFVGPSFVAEASWILLLASVLIALVPRVPEKRMRRVALAVAALGVAYALGAEADVHLRRWMGQRLNIVLVRQFANGALDKGFYASLSHFLLQDRVAVVVSLVLVLAPALAMVGMLFLRSTKWRVPRAPICLLLALATFGASIALEPARRKWRLLAPYGYGLALDVGRDASRAFVRAPTADDLRELSRVAHEDDRATLWRTVPDEAQRFEHARADANARYNVVLIAVESLRGWIADVRSPEAPWRMPNLTALWHERGVAFIHHHANGFPSGEGNMNLSLGLWSHPSRAVAAEYLSIRSRSLGDVLGAAGYTRVWLSGSDPSFDNLQTLMRRSFDIVEVVGSGDDRALVRRAAAHIAATPRDRPFFLSLYTSTMHSPYRVPNERLPKDADEAYERALVYTDRAIGELTTALRASGRYERTLIVITGDHANPTARQIASGLPEPNAGQTWTGMIIAAPNVVGGVVREDVTSHVDVPPTIVARLGLDASNHFMGHDVFAKRRAENDGVVAVLYEGVAWITARAYVIGRVGGAVEAAFSYDNRPDEHAYVNGTRREPTDAERDHFARAARAVRTYTWLLDHDALMP